MKNCWICNKSFHSLGFARHMAMHRDEGLQKIRVSNWDIQRSNLTSDRFHIVKPDGSKFGLFTWNEAIRIALERI